MQIRLKYIGLFFIFFITFSVQKTMAQEVYDPEKDTMPMPPYAERAKKWGPNDTIIVPAVWYMRQMMSAKEEEDVWISKLPPAELAKFKQEWTRLRNAVYVTYPYACVAGRTINEINLQMVGIKNKKQRKEIIKEKEKELRKQFADPLKELSVYQGRVLMKLINRQTGNNCYEILREYQGFIKVAAYQGVAFFFGSTLKQDWSMTDQTDRMIESIVHEIDSRNRYNYNY